MNFTDTRKDRRQVWDKFMRQFADYSEDQVGGEVWFYVMRQAQLNVANQINSRFWFQVRDLVEKGG